MRTAAANRPVQILGSTNQTSNFRGEMDGATELPPLDVLSLAQGLHVGRRQTGAVRIVKNLCSY